MEDDYYDDYYDEDEKNQVELKTVISFIKVCYSLDLELKTELAEHIVKRLSG